MSKLITQRFEYVLFDDATQSIGSSGVITAYPVALDQYSNNATASAGSSYGSANVVAQNSVASTLNVPAGATITMIGAVTNTVNVAVTVNNVALVPGGATVPTLTFPVAPQQMVTLPGVFNTGTLSVTAITTAGALASNAVSVQLLWSV